MLQTKSKTLTKETTLIIEEKDVELLLDLLNKFKKLEKMKLLLKMRLEIQLKLWFYHNKKINNK